MTRPVDELGQTREEPSGPLALADDAADRTHAVNPAAVSGELVRRFTVTVVEGPGAGQARPSSGDRCSLGSHPLNDLVLDDPTVSRFHCEIRVDPVDGARIVDLRSRNGTLVDGLRVNDAFLRNGSSIQLGKARVSFEYAVEQNRIPASASTRFGGLVGTSRAMRATIALLERAAASDATVLLEGETGTGKGRAAEALHKEGARRDAPFIVVDCGSIPANLLESELFGHEKGAFTGAESRRVGAFEEAHGGTLFLDEIGEMSPDLQPKLLRALENREIRRIGSNRYLAIDLRVIAATNRDLRAEVNAGRFRSDLYYRLAVVKATLPPLRERPDDLPALVDELLRQLGAKPDALERLGGAAFVADMQRSAWPGNARELRNHIEARMVLDAVPHATPAPGPAPTVDTGALASFADARRRAIEAFERDYLTGLSGRFSGKVAQAAQAAGIDRVYLYRLLRRHGMKMS